MELAVAFLCECSSELAALQNEEAAYMLQSHIMHAWVCKLIYIYLLFTFNLTLMWLLLTSTANYKNFSRNSWEGCCKNNICISIFLFVFGYELIVQLLIFHKFYSVLKLVSLKKFLSPPCNLTFSDLSGYMGNPDLTQNSFGAEWCVIQTCTTYWTLFLTLMIAASVMELPFSGHFRIGKEKVKTGKVNVTAFMPFPLQHMSVCIHSFRHLGKHLWAVQVLYVQ